ncbi:MAG: hypothetical protein M5R40_03460 [Anaerolineae bacterium]|nr:hypothetical protein [Anaerolineae bacterium]
MPFEGGVTLRSAPALHAPGGYAPATVTLAWEVAADAAGGDVTSFLHAVAGETVVRQDDVPLPTARAEPGEIVVARYTLDRPPGDLALLAGLYTAGAEGVMPLRAEDGRARVAVGALEAVAPVPLPPPTEHPRYDAFADGLVLTGYDYDLSLPGRARLYLHWTYRGAGWADFDLTLSRADAVLATERFRAMAGGHFSTAYDLLPDAAGVRVAIEAAGCGCLSQTLGPFGVRTGYGVDLPGPEPGARYVPLGSGVVLTGVQVSAPAALQPGDRVEVGLRFRAAYPLPEDDAVKVDLIGPGWAWRAQSDHIPRPARSPRSSGCGGARSPIGTRSPSLTALRRPARGSNSRSTTTSHSGPCPSSTPRSRRRADAHDLDGRVTIETSVLPRRCGGTVRRAAVVDSDGMTW